MLRSGRSCAAIITHEGMNAAATISGRPELQHAQVGDKASSNHHKKHPAKLQSFSHKVKKHASDTLPDGSAVDSSKIPAVSMATINAHTSTDSKQNTSDSKQSTVTASKGSMRIQHTGAHSRCRQRISRQLAAVTVRTD